jgi:hypothetical protein
LPGAICTCTSTLRASIPSKATVDTRVTILGLPGPRRIGTRGRELSGSSDESQRFRD